MANHRYEGFPAELREISAQEVEHPITGTTAEQPEAEAASEEISIENPVVTVLISGSDTRGSVIDQRGRSDVNIIARVNRETHEILLVSTPRDYYVPLALSGDLYDKLTHAGIYGMDVLLGTLENLYDTEIDYYFRINFTGFTEIIDALGGLTFPRNTSSPPGATITTLVPTIWMGKRPCPLPGSVTPLPRGTASGAKTRWPSSKGCWKRR